jgi:hypothetical protein
MTFAASLDAIRPLPTLHGLLSIVFFTMYFYD